SSAWFANVFGVDALTIVAIAGRAVPGMELGPAVMPIYTRHPQAMAQQALTTQAAIQGRLAFGIGLPHLVVAEQRLGMPFERPVGSHIAPLLNAAADEAGRSRPRVAVGLPLCVTDDIDSGRARAARIYERYGQLPSYRAMLDREGAAGPADVAIVGSETEVERQFAALESAGATDVYASVFGSAEQKERGYALLGSMVAHGRVSPV